MPLVVSDCAGCRNSSEMLACKEADVTGLLVKLPRVFAATSRRGVRRIERLHAARRVRTVLGALAT
jgi:hypothetical protein